MTTIPPLPFSGQQLRETLVALKDAIEGIEPMPGEDGREIELRSTATHLQWRYVGAATWNDLVALAAITGPAGAQGPQGATGPQGPAGSGEITGSGLTMATARLLGRTTAGAGAVEEIQVSGGTFTGGILTLFDPASPGAIGGTTPASGTFTGLTLPAQATSPVAPATGFRLFADASGRVAWRRSDGWVRTFDASGITADRMWGLPDRSGTLALNGDVTLNTNLQQVFSLGGALGQEITAVSPGAGNTRLIYWNSSTSRWEYLRAGGAFSFISGVLHVTEPFIIPLSGEAQNIAQNTVVLTVPYWQVSEVWPDNLIWQLNTAATGSAAQFDIRVGGTSIYATLPTISAGESNSTTATPAVYSSAFIAAGNTVAVGSSVTFHVIQVGATVAGAGLKVSGVCRRALS